MKILEQLIKNNIKLLRYISLSYLDKAIIFLVPLLILYLFDSKSTYITVEYIYSFVLIAVPFLDFGLTGYFYFHYRESKNKRASILAVTNVFFIVYFLLFALGVLLIAVNYFIYPLEEYIVYIVFRSLFVTLFMFLTSYYRLQNHPKKALYVTMLSNIISLAVIFGYYFLGYEIDIFIIFIGQILFCCYFLIKVIIKFKKRISFNSSKLKIIVSSLLFSWPSMIQVFLMMFIANYGKIKAISNLEIDEATLLSLTQRYAMLIQLMHTSIVAFIIKDIYLEKQKEISKKAFLKYLVFILLSSCVVVFIIFLNWQFKSINISSNRILLVSIVIVVYTALWCVYSYLEMLYSRENKNIIKLYLAIVNAIVFAIVLSLFSIPFLEKVIYAMAASIIISLFVSIIILKKRGYYFTS